MNYFSDKHKTKVHLKAAFDENCKTANSELNSLTLNYSLSFSTLHKH